MCTLCYLDHTSSGRGMEGPAIWFENLTLELLDKKQIPVTLCILWHKVCALTNETNKCFSTVTC